MVVARKSTARISRIDPTRTTTVRKAFLAVLRRKFARLRMELRKLLVEEDAFGLKEKRPVFNADSIVWQRKVGLLSHEEFVDGLLASNRYQFLTTEQKRRAFLEWLKKELRIEDEEALWKEYVRRGFEQGTARSFNDVRQVEGALDAVPIYQTKLREFVSTQLRRPESVEKVKLLAGRAFEDMRGVTDEMALRMSRHLTDGLVRGQHPLEIARTMDKDLEFGRGRSETIARTEIIRAHAEGQLDSMEALGVDKVGVMVEWRTAGDNAVCFPKWTMVQTDKGEMPIQAILPGTMVKTRAGYRRVTANMVRKYSGEMVKVSGGGVNVVATAEHPFYTCSGWVEAVQLRLGDNLQTVNGEFVNIDAVTCFAHELDVYNLEVEDEHEFYANGFLVHNCELCSPLEGVVMPIAEAHGRLPLHPR